VLAAPASAVSVIRNLANFDAVNNTGHHADGFEIELEDPDLWDDSSNAGQHNSSKYVYSVFGLDRNFGGNLGTQVTRFNQVAVTNYDANLGKHAGVRITYGLGGGATPGAGAVFTQAAIPAVVYRAPAPVPGQAGQPVVARIEAVEMEPDRIDRNWGTAVWVKTFTTITKNHDIDLGNLLVGDNGDDDLNANIKKVDIAWKLLQNRPKSQDDEEPDGEDADEAQKDALKLDDNSKSFICRYEFFEYTGGYDADKKNRAFCDNDSDCLKDPMAFGAVGNFLGRQIAGFNADPALAAAVPEPQTWAMFAAGLLAQVGLRRRSRQA